MKKPKIYPLGENAIIVNFGNEISPGVNDLVLHLASYFDQNPFRGYIETVPAYASLTIFFECLQVKKNFPEDDTAFNLVKNFVEKKLSNLTISNNKLPRQIEVPVNFNKKFAIDLEFAAKEKNISIEQFIEIFVSKKYRVYMLGFLPGFAYMGELDKKISTPRKATPRKRVPKGSVGIAGRQTGIYPFESPGGWQIIGKTDVELFTPNEKFPTYFQAGDVVKFVQI